ncbi:MAG: triose-phosphate isomerase [Nanoarchaeota archaeon]|nr:triose-phosphate isomerase [Nanoarchaeota archaeon]
MITMQPVLVVNFKTYKEGTGKNAEQFALIADEVAKSYDVRVILAVQAYDLHQICSAVSLPIYVQHLDPASFGSHTGAMLPEAAKDYGATGTLLNHAERRISLEQLQQTIGRCKDVGLETLVCTDVLGDVEKITPWEPTYIAYEDPKLIGTGNSITGQQGDVIRSFASLVNGTTIPLCGAGVTTGTDVTEALKIGTRGAVFASAIIRTPDHRKLLEELIRALHNGNQQ